VLIDGDRRIERRRGRGHVYSGPMLALCLAVAACGGSSSGSSGTQAAHSALGAVTTSTSAGAAGASPTAGSTAKPSTSAPGAHAGATAAAHPPAGVTTPHPAYPPTTAPGERSGRTHSLPTLAHRPPAPAYREHLEAWDACMRARGVTNLPPLNYSGSAGLFTHKFVRTEVYRRAWQECTPDLVAASRVLLERR
jgi:hypothetical protein